MSVEPSHNANGNGGRQSFPLRKFALIAGLLTVAGYVFVFLPIQYPLFDYLVFPGLLLAFAGMGMLIASMVIYSRRWKVNERNWTLTYSAVRGGYKTIIVGIIALVITRIIQALVWPVPAELSSQANASLMQNLGPAISGGIFWGFVIGFYFVRYSYKIPLASPVYRAIVISFLAVLVVNALGTLLHLNDLVSYFLWGVAYSIPHYFVLGVVLGYSYKKFDSEQAIQTLREQPVKRRLRLYSFLAMAVFIGLGFASITYQNSLEPVSFTASGIHFDTSGGIIHVIANVTNPSQPEIIQVNAAIDGLDDGICGYGIQTNQTIICNFSSPSGGVPLVSCAQVGHAENYTLTLNAYFANTKTVINTYKITPAQLGCG